MFSKLLYKSLIVICIEIFWYYSMFSLYETKNQYKNEENICKFNWYLFVCSLVVDWLSAL